MLQQSGKFGWLWGFMLAGSAAIGAARASEVDLSTIAATWPAVFDMQGSKIEPTWVEYVRLRRDGDRFVLEGGGLHGGEQSVETVEVDAKGAIRHLVCPKAMDCSETRPFSGFLASAQFLAAHRAGRLSGRAAVERYGERDLFCLPGEQLGIAEPILDPCFDVATGAMLAQRMRTDGSFSGPTLDPATIRFVEPNHQPKDKN